MSQKTSWLLVAVVQYICKIWVLLSRLAIIHGLGKLGGKSSLSTIMLITFTQNKAKGMKVNSKNKSVIKLSGRRRLWQTAGDRDSRSWRVCKNWCWCELTSVSPWQTLIKSLFKEQGYGDVDHNPVRLPQAEVHCTCTTNHSDTCTDLAGSHDPHKNMLTALGSCLDGLWQLYILLLLWSISYVQIQCSLWTWLPRRAALTSLV